MKNTWGKEYFEPSSKISMQSWRSDVFVQLNFGEKLTDDVTQMTREMMLESEKRAAFDSGLPS